MTQPYTPNDHPDVVNHRAAIRAEYARLIAVQDIPVGQALAYRRGDPIPETNSDLYGYEARGLAVERDSDAGREILAAARDATGAGAGQDPAAAMQALALASADDLAPAPARRAAASKAAVTKPAQAAKATGTATSTKEGE